MQIYSKSAIMVIKFWNFLMFEEIFLSLKVKRSVIISNKNGIYKLSHKLPNDLRLTILGNQEISRKPQKFIEL